MIKITRFIFLLLLSSSMVNAIDPGMFPNMFNNGDSFDEEDDTPGLIGFCKRHKIVTGLSLVCSLAGIVIYNNITLWNKFLDAKSQATAFTAEVYEELFPKSPNDIKNTSNSNVLENNKTHKPEIKHKPEVKHTLKDDNVKNNAEPIINNDELVIKKNNMPFKTFDQGLSSMIQFVRKASKWVKSTKDIYLSVKPIEKGISKDADTIVLEIKLAVGCLEVRCEEGQDVLLICPFEDDGKMLGLIDKSSVKIVDTYRNLEKNCENSGKIVDEMLPLFEEAINIINANEVTRFMKKSSIKLDEGRPSYLAKPGEIVTGAVGFAALLVLYFFNKKP